MRPVTRRVSYEWSCSFKAMFMYVLYRNIPWILKWAFMYECCSPEELIQGFGGRETTVTWLREMGVQADKTMSCEELAALMKSLPQFDTEAVSKFTAAQALFGNHYYMAEYSDPSYWTVRKRLEEQYSLPVLIQLTERCCQRVE